MSMSLARITSLLVIFLSIPGVALAFQEHGAEEGIYIHQIAHVCFGISMLWLFFMIKRSAFWEQKWWRYIGAGAIILAIWNVMTAVGHMIAPFIAFYCDRLLSGDRGLEFWVWYIAKMDTVVCSMAMLCFYLGLRKLYLSIKKSQEQQLTDQQES